MEQQCKLLRLMYSSFLERRFQALVDSPTISLNQFTVNTQHRTKGNVRNGSRYINYIVFNKDPELLFVLFEDLPYYIMHLRNLVKVRNNSKQILIPRS